MAYLFSICLLFQEQFNLSGYQQRNVCALEHNIRVEAAKNDLEPELLAALIFVESAFRPNVVSSANACGLTQVIPKWTGGPETKGIRYTCQELKDPETSIKVGAQILSYNIRVYGKGNENKGLCVYNAGIRCITRKGYYKRLYYVKKVRDIYNILVNDC